MSVVTQEVSYRICLKDIFPFSLLFLEASSVLQRQTNYCKYVCVCVCMSSEGRELSLMLSLLPFYLILEV